MHRISGIAHVALPPPSPNYITLPSLPSHSAYRLTRLWLSTTVNSPTDIATPLRKYPEAKLQENLDSEIMEVLLQEARDSYAPEMVVELTSNTTDEMESNLDRIESWFKQWKKDNAEGGEGEGKDGAAEGGRE